MIEGPNLFVIGAMKSGTSSLHQYLNAHPQIFMTADKEPSYFLDFEELTSVWPELASRWPYTEFDNYLSLFEDGKHCRYKGESSTVYTKYPKVQSPAKLIYQYAPHARLIYIMRDPIERSISHYWHAVANDGEYRPPLKAFKSDSHYIEVSDYYSQIKTYLQHFPISQMYFLTTEELEQDPQRAIGDLLVWLGLDSTEIVSGDSRFNVTPSAVEQAALRGFLQQIRSSPAYEAIENYLPKSLKQYASGKVKKSINRDGVPLEDARLYLKKALAEPRIRLETLLERTFPMWQGD